MVCLSLVSGMIIEKLVGCLSSPSYLIDHIHELSLGGVLSKGAHDSSELLGGDSSCEELKEVKRRERVRTVPRDEI